MSLRIVQITDTHISGEHPVRTDDLARCVEAINNLDTQPALVVHTGDVSHNGNDAEYAVAKELLDTLQAPYCVMTGNRDKRENLMKSFGDNPFMQDCEKFVQFAIDEFDVKLIFLDTLSTTSNKGKLCKDRLYHFKQMLDESTDKPLAVFMHHPPFKVEEIPEPQQFEKWEDVSNFEALIRRMDNIKGIFCGHVHRNVESKLDDIPIRVLTCNAGDLRKGDVSDEDRQHPVYRELTLSV